MIRKIIKNPNIKKILHPKKHPNPIIQNTKKVKRIKVRKKVMIVAVMKKEMEMKVHHPVKIVVMTTVMITILVMATKVINQVMTVLFKNKISNN